MRPEPNSYRTTPRELEEISWLATQGRRFLNDDASQAERDRLPAVQRRLVDEQLGFQRRCRRRFPSPEDWLWTNRSLAQASDWWTAHFKASLVPSGEQAIDACCGAGVDLVALAKRGPALGIDSDELVLALAEVNTVQHACQAEFRSNHIHQHTRLAASNWLHIDPDRRVGGRRTQQSEDFSPPLSQAFELSSKVRGAVIKLPPQTKITSADLVDSGRALPITRLWCGVYGECRQQLWLTGALREILADRFELDAEQRAAVLVHPQLEDRSQFDHHLFAGKSSKSAVAAELSRANGQACASQLGSGDYVYELDATLHAADLQAEWAEMNGLAPLTNADGYYVSENHLESPWLQAFEVLQVVGWDDRRVRRALHELKAGLVEVKNRLVKLDAGRFQKRFSREQGQAVTLLVTRMDDRTRCILARRIPAVS